MIPLTGPGQTKFYRLVGLWLASFVCLVIWTAWYSTAKSESGLVPAQSGTFAPFLNVVPSDDGQELFISAGQMGQVGGTVVANISLGPGHKKGGTMTYSSAVQAYVTTIEPGFSAGVNQAGTLNFTTTLGLDTGPVEFNRAYLPASTLQMIGSVDGNLQLGVVSTDTISFDTYVVAVPSYAPPGPAPVGHRFVGSSYSVRASGALLVTTKPMSLRLYYSETTLTGADPHTLAIFAWDAFNKRWDNLGGRLFSTQKYLSVATSRFTTYALMAAPAWRDDFDDATGLDQQSNVAHISSQLVLSDTAISGFATSKPITPLTPIASWGNLTFTHTFTPPTVTLTVDVLSSAGTPLLTNVASGASLAGLDPVQYPALKLRANLASISSQTPVLEQWQLTWQAKEYRVYLPVVRK